MRYWIAELALPSRKAGERRRGAVHGGRMSDTNYREDSPPSHPSQFRGNKPTTAFDRAIRAMVPLGSQDEILALFHGKASWSAIRHWRAGRWGPPQWAIDCLRERAAPIAELQAGPGTGAQLIAWLKAHGRYPAKEKARIERA